jgi:hypothetical protein
MHPDLRLATLQQADDVASGSPLLPNPNIATPRQQHPVIITGHGNTAYLKFHLDLVPNEKHGSTDLRLRSARTNLMVLDGCQLQICCSMSYRVWRSKL